MKSENYTKALDDLNFARESMQAQLTIATAYEGVLILQVLRQIAETQSMLASMLDASRQEDSLLNI